VLRRLRGSRALKFGFVLLAITLLAYALISQWDKAWSALSALSWLSVAGALVAGGLALGPAMMAWRALLADLGSPLPLSAATQIMFIGNLGKYVPGGVWQVLATVEMGREHATPAKRTLTATVVGMALALGSALALTALALPLTSSNATRQYWWVLALVPFVLVALHPRVLTTALNLALRLARKEPLERAISLPGLVRALAWTVLGWLLLGTMTWLLVADIHRGGLADYLPAAAAYLLAWAVGFMAIFAPGGIGVREVAMAAALAPLMGGVQALVVATVTRLISTVADLSWAGFAFLLNSRRRKGMNPIPADFSSVAELAQRAAGPTEETS
jgi:uncharacterized membrane protein YbhN (UPF0104 family)